MSETLYHQDILATARLSVGARRLDAPTATAVVDNPLCGDRVTVDLRIEDGVVTEVGHQVKGCALCQASAAVLSEEALGKPVAEVAAAEESLTEMIARDGPAPAGWPRLAMFEPVRGVKNRHQCVLLPFRAARNAIESVVRKTG